MLNKYIIDDVINLFSEIYLCKIFYFIKNIFILLNINVIVFFII